MLKTFTKRGELHRSNKISRAKRATVIDRRAYDDTILGLIWIVGIQDNLSIRYNVDLIEKNSYKKT